jgi:membrane protein DedA with SNARE-associated domain
VEAIVHLVHAYGSWAIFCLLALGIVGLPVPDETLLLLSGYLVFKGELLPLSTVLAALAGSITGVSISYLLGRVPGEYLLGKAAPLLHLREDAVSRARAWITRRGKWALVIGYFIPGVRHFTAFMAGTSDLAYPVFATFAYSGAFIWVSTFLCTGYFSGEEWSHLPASMHRIMMIIAGILLALFLAGALVKYLLGKRSAS